jgi:transmembrane sensor
MSKIRRHRLPLIEQAAQWVVNMSANEVSAEQRMAFESWLAQDPRHGEVYKQAERIWQAAAAPTESLHRVPARSRIGNRPGALMAILLLVGSIYLAPLSEWMADERTDAGEIRQITLADGSLLTLDSKSSVDIAFTDNERRLILRAGRLLVDVASDSAGNKRPFLVENRDGLSQAMGTRYVVEQAEKDSLVSVIESQVVVRSHGQPDKSVGLEAGQSVRFDNQKVGQPEASLPSASSWIQARLVYEDVPLGQVIADLGRYQRVYVKLDPEVAALRFTGILPATDPEAALSLLKGALPIQIKSYTDWLVWIGTQQP